MTREDFRRECVERDGGNCTVPWCDEEVTVDPDGPGEVHHIIERELWEDGGYIPDNGASVCNLHHHHAEECYIPPQAFWRWVGVDEPPLPSSIDNTAINKWGDSLETPPHQELRAFHKYPSSRHLLPLYWESERGTADERTGRDDTGLSSVEPFIGVPLVCTVKMDGSNAMLVKDSDEPVRARNGRDADHESFDYLKQLYDEKNIYTKLPENLQVFGEWLYAKHSIHYGCQCDSLCEDVGPMLYGYFQVFGIYDTDYNIWLSWPEVEHAAEQLDFPTVPLVDEHTFDRNAYADEQTLIRHYTEEGERLVDKGHEGLIIRSKYPFHYGEFGHRLGKYVRPNHVKTDDHWSHQEVLSNELR